MWSDAARGLQAKVGVRSRGCVCAAVPVCVAHVWRGLDVGLSVGLVGLCVVLRVGLSWCLCLCVSVSVSARVGKHASSKDEAPLDNTTKECATARRQHAVRACAFAVAERRLWTLIKTCGCNAARG